MSGDGYLVLFVLCLQPSSYWSQCRSLDDYSNKGLSPQSLPPYSNQQIVSYSCSHGRQTPNNSPTTTKCLNGRLLPQQSNWPDCECRPVTELACKSAQLRSVYPPGGGVLFSLHIPDLLSASYWSLDVRLSYSNLNSSSFKVQTSGDHSLSYDGQLTINSSLKQPPTSDGLLLINLTVPTSLYISPYRWQYPCVKNIQCSLVSPALLTLSGNIILSCVCLVLTILLCCSLKLCYWRADQNDKARERHSRKKAGGKANKLVVETVPAVDQHCRVNNNLEKRAMAEDYHKLKEGLDGRLLYSYHARTPPSRNDNQQLVLQYYKHNHHHHRHQHHHREHPGSTYNREYPGTVRDQAVNNKEYYREYPASTNHSRKQKRSSERDNISMTEVWNTAHQ